MSANYTAPGSASQPAWAFDSEQSLGLYRSGASAIGVSYGQLQLAAGTALLPALAVSSESSLGFYRSGVSTLGLSYGALAFPAASLATPSMAFSSETSLGWYRSAASTMALSYGTLTALEGSITSLSGTVFQVGTPGDSKVAYSNLDGLRIGGDDTTNTIYQASGSLGLAVNSGKTLSLGGLSASYSGFSGLQIYITTGASLHSDGRPTIPMMAFWSEQSLGLYRSGVSTLAVSYGTVNLATQAVRLSMRTLAASAVTVTAAKTNVAVDEVVFTIGGASGASLCIYSGGSVYIFNSALSAAAS